MERHKILTTAINHYGPDNQILKTMEEAGELIRALARFKIAMNAKEIDDSAWGNLAEEIADIEIMLQQIRLIIPGINRDIETIKEAKLIRLEQKLKERGSHNGMKEVLLNIGSIVEVEHKGETRRNIIVGKRIIHHRTMKAWDYYSVPYPEGLRRDREGSDDNGFYFNHPEIDKIVYACKLKERGAYE